MRFALMLPRFANVRLASRPGGLVPAAGLLPASCRLKADGSYT